MRASACLAGALVLVVAGAVAAAAAAEECEPYSLAVEISYSCTADAPLRPCCRPIEAAVEHGVEGGDDCFCRVVEQLIQIHAALNESNLVGLYSFCRGISNIRLTAACDQAPPSTPTNGSAPPAPETTLQSTFSLPQQKKSSVLWTFIVLTAILVVIISLVILIDIVQRRGAPACESTDVEMAILGGETTDETDMLGALISEKGTEGLRGNSQIISQLHRRRRKKPAKHKKQPRVTARASKIISKRRAGRAKFSTPIADRVCDPFKTPQMSASIKRARVNRMAMNGFDTLLAKFAADREERGTMEYF